MLDLPSRADRLRAVVRAADIVIDASRPRAMSQLGIDVHEIAAGGTVWVSITGHGRDGPGAGRVAFGDDAAVAGGLVAADGGGPVFVADAVADPLAGMVAAVAALDRFAAGGGWVVDVSMARVAAWCAVTPPPADPWTGPAAPPRARPRRRHCRASRTGHRPRPAGARRVKSVRFRRAEVDGAIVDVRCAGGCVTDVAPSVPAADVVVDADGGALLPGLHDHHIHLFALAAARTSIDLASGDVGGRSRRGRPLGRRIVGRDHGCASSAITSRSTGRSIATASICWRPTRPRPRAAPHGGDVGAQHVWTRAGRPARRRRCRARGGRPADRAAVRDGRRHATSASSSSRSTWPPLDASWPPTG